MSNRGWKRLVLPSLLLALAAFTTSPGYTDDSRFDPLARATLAAPGGRVALKSTACARPAPDDADCDGLPNHADPCPTEMLNRCVGPVAICGVGSPQDCLVSLPLRLDLGNTAPQIDCAAADS